MRKLTLSIEDLDVASFYPQRTPAPSGTVHGHETEDYTAVLPGTCYNTCAVLCIHDSLLCGSGSPYPSANTACGQRTCVAQTCELSCGWGGPTCGNSCGADCTVQCTVTSPCGC